tara:strand:+ start:13087 stop:13482 length:396 start_codon:yes stop_codon:yes gene_type:complete
MNLSNFKLNKKHFKGVLSLGVIVALGFGLNAVSLSKEEKQSALEVASVVVEGYSQKIPCNGWNLLTLNMVGEENRKFLAEEVRANIHKEVRGAYNYVGGKNSEGHSFYYWWYSEWKATTALDAVVDKCFRL